MKELKVIRAIEPLLRRHPLALVGMVVLGLLEAVTEGLGISLFIPFLYSLDSQVVTPGEGGVLAETLNGFFAHIPAADRLAFVAGAIFALVLFKSAVSYGNGVLFSWVDSRLSHHLRCRVVDQLLRVGVRFIERSKSGKLWNALESETWTAASSVSTVVGLIINLATIVIFTSVLLLISWQMTLIVASALFLISAMVQLMSRRVEKLSRAGLEADESMAQRVIDLFAGMRTIRAFGRERHERRRYHEASARVRGLDLKKERLTGLVEPVSELLAAGLLIGVLFAMLHGNTGNLPAALVFIVILYRLHPEVYGLDEGRVDLAGQLPAVEEVMGLLQAEGKPYVRSGSVEFAELERSIELRSVSFRYDAKDAEALDDVSLSIRRGETVAVVGPSGAGKTTLINLLLRFYEPTAGTIRVDDRPIEELDLGTWRDKIAVVSQDVHVFDTTVRENIAYGKLDANDAEIRKAARLADAEAFIGELPDGYETRIGDRGVRLSGGQKQRLALARALIRNPQILILDEATNALDSLSESVIQSSLQKLRRDRTVIVIAHRLSTIEQADQILVLDEGRVSERGTLADLLANNALFARLYELQKRPSELAEIA